MRVYYTVECENDINSDITLEAILNNEKIVRLLKLEFAKKAANVAIHQVLNDAGVIAQAKSVKTVYEFDIAKDDFADALTFAEEDAKKHKRLKKGCQGVALVDIKTL